MKRMCSIVPLVLAGLLLASPAMAQSNEEIANGHFEAGAEHYFNGEYGKAIVEFMKGHSLMPNALFLYNISLSHVKLGNTREALENAMKAKTMGGLDDATAMQNEGRIVALRRVMLAQTFEPVEPVASIESSVEPVETSGGFGTLGWVGVGTTVVGVGLLTAAGLVELGLQDKWDEYEAAAEANDQARYDELKTEIEDDQSTGLILLAAGAGVTIVGATLITVELLSGEEGDATSRLFVRPTTDGGLVGLAGSF